ncbi:PREDICTED: uncharacterized protein LOC105558980 [Vollenhovia emeryi]|uniref:uncharacterized protein LOC105558980 n=1 Tax=Vollenhovia emeryi TaxID=411798 RepID=UPI0005F3879D|nr:PREDICTED: uncharacterized protein LOC105558980 [Vollenhovia emeryi]
MFLIQCEDDSSYCIVDNHDVICDENIIENGDTVTFFWNKKKFSGNIIMRSENVELLNKEIRKLKKTDMCKKKRLTLHNVVASGKRKTVLNKTCMSLDRPSTSSTKKMKLDNISEKVIISLRYNNKLLRPR